MNRVDPSYWKNPMFFMEAQTSIDVLEFIQYISKRKVPFSAYLNGATYNFKHEDYKKQFIAGLKAFMKLELPFDVLH